jgi:hypothetical protein
MARPHSLMLWSIVLTFLAAASLCAADAKEPKPKHAKAPAAKSTPHRSDDPFAGHEKHSAPSAKKPSKPAVKPLRPWENVARIEAALASPTEICFIEAPLTEILDYLKEQHHIEIQIDLRGLEDVGIGTDSPVTIDLKGISLRSALNLMLRKLNLTWLIEDEVLIITTVEEAENHLDTKVYDVADLVICRDEHDVPWDDFDALIDIITSTIKPTTWDGVGGPGAIKGNTLGTAKVLIVSQTCDVHEEIAGLLKDIRELAKKNPNAGPPRRNKPILPAPQKNANQSSLGDKSTSGAGRPAAPHSAPADAPAPKQERQSPMPGAHKDCGMGKS